jgi:hypothetical protein
MKIRLQKVHCIPKELQPCVLYVSKEFGIAVHLCACGCGSKIRTPLGPTEWSVQQTWSGPSLDPSVGNWQESCKSHYWIHRGEISWADMWTPEQIAAGRLREEQYRAAYYEARGFGHKGLLQRLWLWARGLFSKR